MASPSTDDILTELKPFGRVQVGFLLSSAFVQFFLPMTYQSVNFLAATPDHHCSLTDGYYINQSIPLEEDELGRQIYSQCQEYVNPDNQNQTQSCQNGLDYDHDIYGETIISEWDLVCNENAAAELSQSILSVGGIFGSIIFGMIADHYGRRPAFLIGMAFFNIFGIALCFSPNFIVFIILRFFYGFFQTATWLPFSSAVAEYMIPKYRNRAINVPSIAFCFGLMFMAVLAFLIRDWRYLQLAIMLPTVIGMFGMWFLPESLRWQMLTGNEAKVKTLVHRLAKMNRTNAPQIISLSKSSVGSKNGLFTISGSKGDKSYDKSPQKPNVKNNRVQKHPPDGETDSDITNNDATSKEEVPNEEAKDTNSISKSKRDGFLDLFKPPVLHITLVLSVTRFTYFVVYFGFALSTGRLSGNPYLNYFLSSLVEVPARMLSPLVYKWFRRTYVVTVCYIVCSVGLLLTIFIPNETKNGLDLSILTNILALLGKFFVTITLGGLLLLVMELFPTNVRNIGSGLTLAMGRVGGTVAPFMLYMDNSIPNFSLIIMASMSIIAGVLVFMLPDTRRTTQPQNSDDLRIIMKSRQQKNAKGTGSGRENEAFQGDTPI